MSITSFDQVETILNNLVNQGNAALSNLSNQINQVLNTSLRNANSLGNAINEIGHGLGITMFKGTDPSKRGKQQVVGLSPEEIISVVAGKFQGDQFINVVDNTASTGFFNITFNIGTAQGIIFNNIKTDGTYITKTLNNDGTITIGFNINAIINDDATEGNSYTWSIDKIKSVVENLSNYFNNVISNLQTGLLKFIGTVQSTAPTNPNAGDWWIDSSDTGSTPLPTSVENLQQWGSNEWTLMEYEPKDWDVWVNYNDAPDSTWYWLAGEWHQLNFSINLNDYVTGDEFNEFVTNITNKLDSAVLTFNMPDGTTIVYNPGTGEAKQVTIPAGGGGGSTGNYVLFPPYRAASTTISDVINNTTTVYSENLQVGQLYIDANNRLGVVESISGNSKVVRTLALPPTTPYNGSLTISINNETNLVSGNPYTPSGGAQNINLTINPFDFGGGSGGNQQTPIQGIFSMYGNGSVFTTDTSVNGGNAVNQWYPSLDPQGKKCWCRQTRQNPNAVAYDYSTIPSATLIFAFYGSAYTTFSIFNVDMDATRMFFVMPIGTAGYNLYMGGSVATMPNQDQIGTNAGNNYNSNGQGLAILLQLPRENSQATTSYVRYGIMQIGLPTANITNIN